MERVSVTISIPKTVAPAPKARHAIRSDEELLEDTITEAYL